MAKITFKNIVAYIQGKVRYRLYYSLFKKLIPRHVLEQIDWRVGIMDPKCYDSGSCVLCGCETIALQMANKACDKPCYPPMLDKRTWIKFKKNLKLFKGISLSPAYTTGKRVLWQDVLNRTKNELGK
jgi:hypothetical protein